MYTSGAPLVSSYNPPLQGRQKFSCLSIKEDVETRANNKMRSIL